MIKDATTNLEQLLSALDSKDEQIRADAIRQVRMLPPTALLTLSGLEVQHFRKYRSTQRDQNVLVQVGVFGLIACGSYLTTGKQYLFMVLMFMLLMQVIIHAFIFPRVMIYLNGGFQPSRARRSLTAALGGIEDVSFMPVALTLLQDKTPEITPVVHSLLKRLLPQLHVADAQTWLPEQVQALLKLLSPSQKDVELLLCVLKALEKIGDARAISYVEAIGSGITRHTSSQVQQAAKECLPYLQQRAGEQRQAQTLLRATHPHTTGEHLLRPIAQATPQMPDEQLLRPQQAGTMDTLSN